MRFHPKAVFFDLDGVLVDACHWHFTAFNQALKELTGKEITYEFHLAHLNGRPTKNKMEILEIPTHLRQRLWELKQTYTFLTIETMAQPDPVKIEMHQWLSDQGIESWCITNSIAATAKVMLDKTGQLPFIVDMVSNEMISANKPDPACYNLALNMSGYEPHEVIIVEDSPVGMAAAQASKIGTLLKVAGPQDVNTALFKDIIQ